MTDAIRQLCADVVLDGELVLWRRGRLDFEGLQRRLASSRRSRDAGDVCFVVFDVLAYHRTDLRSRPYRGGERSWR